MRNNDEQWMRQALDLARQAALMGEVPVGAILVKEGTVIATGHNQPITCVDPTAHAEIMALREGAKNLGNYRLNGTTLYVTLEPCAMCIGAILHARVERLVFGAFDPRGDASRLSHRLQWVGGVLAEPCAEILQTFFREKRLKT